MMVMHCTNDMIMQMRILIKSIHMMNMQVMILIKRIHMMIMQMIFFYKENILMIELKIRNIFKRHLLDNWSKFKIISQNCSL